MMRGIQAVAYCALYERATCLVDGHERPLDEARERLYARPETVAVLAELQPKGWTKTWITRDLPNRARLAEPMAKRTDARERRLPAREELAAMLDIATQERALFDAQDAALQAKGWRPSKYDPGQWYPVGANGKALQPVRKHLVGRGEALVKAGLVAPEAGPPSEAANLHTVTIEGVEYAVPLHLHVYDHGEGQGVRCTSCDARDPQGFGAKLRHTWACDIHPKTIEGDVREKAAARKVVTDRTSPTAAEVRHAAREGGVDGSQRASASIVSPVARGRTPSRSRARPARRPTSRRKGRSPRWASPGNRRSTSVTLAE